MHDSHRGQRIAILIESGPPANDTSGASRKPTLEDKVNYALDNIEGEFNIKKSVDFLCKVYCYLEKKCDCGQLSPAEESLAARILPALEDYAPHVLNSEFYVRIKRELDEDETPPAAKPY
jgi:hypothetical protein